MTVGKEGIQMDPVKLKAIWEWSPPANVKAIWFFLGFYNFYWKFIPSFSNITHPLLDLIKQLNPWTWGPDQKKCFGTCKSCSLDNWSLPSQHLQTLHPHDRCLFNGIRSGAHVAQHKWRHAAMWLSLPDLLTHQMQLQYLWLGVASHYPWPQRMKTISSWIPLPCRGSYRPQESHLLQGTPQTVLITSLVASHPPRLWHSLWSPPWNKNGLCRCPIPLEWCRHLPEQHWCPTTSLQCLWSTTSHHWHGLGR